MLTRSIYDITGRRYVQVSTYMRTHSCSFEEAVESLGSLSHASGRGADVPFQTELNGLLQISSRLSEMRQQWNENGPPLQIMRNDVSIIREDVLIHYLKILLVPNQNVQMTR